MTLAWDCQEYRVLPEAGGLYDQDYQTMRYMKTLSNVYDSIKAAKSAKGDSIHRLSPAVGAILDSLYEMGISIGGLE